MKKLLLALAFIPITSFAEPIKEMYVPLDQNVQLAITNQPCKTFIAPETIQLNHAYAVNISTGERVEGCFTHNDDIIQIELKDENGNFYSYKVHADKFVVRPNL